MGRYSKLVQRLCCSGELLWSVPGAEQLQTACRCGPNGQLLMSDSIMFSQIPL